MGPAPPLAHSPPLAPAMLASLSVEWAEQPLLRLLTSAVLSAERVFLSPLPLKDSCSLSRVQPSTTSSWESSMQGQPGLLPLDGTARARHNRR